MPKNRQSQICLSETPYYLITSRCVRRAFLAGYDKENDVNYEYRRQWIEGRIRLLSSCFAIDVLAYAVMSNHYHILAKIDTGESETWSTADTIKRWLSVYKGPMIARRWLDGLATTKPELQTIEEMAIEWKKKLSSISWFMKCLNEPIAKRANKEEKITGHFWESRFKSDALFDKKAVLTCAAYIDLNPVRADMADTPEESAHTSIKERLTPTFDLQRAIESHLHQGGNDTYLLEEESPIPIKPLTEFTGDYQQIKHSGFNFDFKDYLELLDYTGRIIRADKKSSIAEDLPPILKRLNISTNEWLITSQNFETLYQQRFKARERKKMAA